VKGTKLQGTNDEKPKQIKMKELYKIEEEKNETIFLLKKRKGKKS